MRTYQQIFVYGLLLGVFISVVNCYERTAETADNVRNNLSFYREFMVKVKSQNEVDFLLITNDRYTFVSGDIVYSGRFDIAHKKIEQTHYKKIPLTDKYKEIILKWLTILSKDNICGFDVRSNTMSSIYIFPEVKLLFLEEHGYEDSWKDKPDKWTDYRGATYFRIDKNIYLVSEK